MEFDKEEYRKRRAEGKRGQNEQISSAMITPPLGWANKHSHERARLGGGPRQVRRRIKLDEEKNQ